MGNPMLTPDMLYETYYPRLYQRAYRLLGNAEQAEDATQDTFVKALRALPTLATMKNLSGWLYRIVTNTAYDVLRRRRCLSWQSLDECDPVFLALQKTQDPQECYPTQELVRRVLARLPNGYQRALVMQAALGYSPQDIATALGIAPGGAKMYLSRARRAFRQAYAKEMAWNA